jgi:hypothetical protein
LAQIFGFIQFEFAGTLAIADGRYLARLGPEQERQSVLVIETRGAPRPPNKRRSRPRESDAGLAPTALPLTVATTVRAFDPFDTEEEARRWLGQASEAEAMLDALVGEGIDLLNRALHAHATASADPHLNQLRAERAVAVRVGYGRGEQVASGRFSSSRDIDVWAREASSRKRRAESLRPQERTAAILGGREQIDVCETLLLRARADLDAGRRAEAALQLQIGTKALLAELAGALEDPGHEKDIKLLIERGSQIDELAEAALNGELDAMAIAVAGETLEICERVLRRRRLLRP